MNKKGFTLIELLAAILIMGILFAISLPLITNIINSNRSKVYITDAQRLVTLAEYNIRSKSSQIQLPSGGYSIVFTLDYLNTGEFKNSPYNGTYEQKKSFVVVKNTGTALEYSVMLIEKHMESYRGILLTRRENLVDAKTKDYVKDYTLASVDNSLSITEASLASYINSRLGGGYVSGVSHIYQK